MTFLYLLLYSAVSCLQNRIPPGGLGSVPANIAAQRAPIQTTITEASGEILPEAPSEILDLDRNRTDAVFYMTHKNSILN